MPITKGPSKKKGVKGKKKDKFPPYPAVGATSEEIRAYLDANLTAKLKGALKILAYQLHLDLPQQLGVIAHTLMKPKSAIQALVDRCAQAPVEPASPAAPPAKPSASSLLLLPPDFVDRVAFAIADAFGPRNAELGAAVKQRLARVTAIGDADQWEQHLRWLLPLGFVLPPGEFAIPLRDEYDDSPSTDTWLLAEAAERLQIRLKSEHAAANLEEIAVQLLEAQASDDRAAVQRILEGVLIALPTRTSLAADGFRTELAAAALAAPRNVQLHRLVAGPLTPQAKATAISIPARIEQVGSAHLEMLRALGAEIIALVAAVQDRVRTLPVVSLSAAPEDEGEPARDREARRPSASGREAVPDTAEAHRQGADDLLEAMQLPSSRPTTVEPLHPVSIGIGEGGVLRGYAEPPAVSARLSGEALEPESPPPEEEAPTPPPHSVGEGGRPVTPPASPPASPPPASDEGERDAVAGVAAAEGDEPGATPEARVAAPDDATPPSPSTGVRQVNFDEPDRAAAAAPPAHAAPETAWDAPLSFDAHFLPLLESGGAALDECVASLAGSLPALIEDVFQDYLGALEKGIAGPFARTLLASPIWAEQLSKGKEALTAVLTDAGKFIAATIPPLKQRTDDDIERAVWAILAQFVAFEAAWRQVQATLGIEDPEEREETGGGGEGLGHAPRTSSVGLPIAADAREPSAGGSADPPPPIPVRVMDGGGEGWAVPLASEPSHIPGDGPFHLDGEAVSDLPPVERLELNAATREEDDESARGWDAPQGDEAADEIPQHQAFAEELAAPPPDPSELQEANGAEERRTSASAAEAASAAEHASASEPSSSLPALQSAEGPTAVINGVHLASPPVIKKSESKRLDLLSTAPAAPVTKEDIEARIRQAELQKKNVLLAFNAARSDWETSVLLAGIAPILDALNWRPEKPVAAVAGLQKDVQALGWAWAGLVTALGDALDPLAELLRSFQAVLSEAEAQVEACLRFYRMAPGGDARSRAGSAAVSRRGSGVFEPVSRRGSVFEAISRRVSVVDLAGGGDAGVSRRGSMVENSMPAPHMHPESVLDTKRSAVQFAEHPQNGHASDVHVHSDGEGLKTLRASLRSQSVAAPSKRPDIAAATLGVLWGQQIDQTGARLRDEIATRLAPASSTLAALCASLRDKVAALERQHEDAVALFEASQKQAQPAEGRKAAAPKLPPATPWAARKLEALLSGVGTLASVAADEGVKSLLRLLCAWLRFPTEPPPQTIARAALEVGVSGRLSARRPYTQQRRQMQAQRDVAALDNALRDHVAAAHSSVRAKTDGFAQTAIEILRASV